MIISAASLGGARGGRPAAPQEVGARASPAHTRPPPHRTERDRERPTHQAGDKRPVVKQKECWLGRFEAPAPLPAL
ncbi:unnamed protein product [Danaus chrysippus]|uniref:(African queen) hypothetical protein n=1 Tax=Danaus chrysippus TaxID=151541 RepID=A0A8J2RBK3_9NEOP|nr:unnamed protein product [Danaus chrysippus]